MQKKRAGGCRCGDVRFLLIGEPNSVWACHCSNCQTTTGSVCMLSVAVPAHALEISKGQPETVPIEQTTITNYYCGSCVSHLFSEDTDKPGLRIVSLARCRNDECRVPARKSRRSVLTVDPRCDR